MFGVSFKSIKIRCDLFTFFRIENKQPQAPRQETQHFCRKNRTNHENDKPKNEFINETEKQTKDILEDSMRGNFGVCTYIVSWTCMNMSTNTSRKQNYQRKQNQKRREKKSEKNGAKISFFPRKMWLNWSRWRTGRTCDLRTQRILATKRQKWAK